MLTGLGDVCCYKASNLDDVPKDSLKWYADARYRLRDDRALAGGFASLRLTEQGMAVTYHDQDGDVLFAAEPVAPRPKAKAAV